MHKEQDNHVGYSGRIIVTRALAKVEVGQLQLIWPYFAHGPVIQGRPVGEVGPSELE